MMKMRTMVVLVWSAWLSLPVSASEGVMSSGGMPPAPRAVVVQEYGVEDLAGSRVASIVDQLAQAAMEQGLVVTYKNDYQGGNRLSWCIEYVSYAQYLEADKMFKEALADFDQVEVVSARTCR